MSTDNKRQFSIRQKDTQEMSFNGLSIEDDFVLYVYKKIEKLSTAVFLVTGHLSEQEVIRTDLRSGILSLIKKTNFNFEHKQKNNSFVFYSVDEEKNYYDETVSSLIKIKSLLCIGRDSFLLNQNNCNVLLKVINDLLEELAGRKNTTKQQASIFSENYFSVTGPANDTPTETANNQSVEYTSLHAADVYDSLDQNAAEEIDVISDHKNKLSLSENQKSDTESLERFHVQSSTKSSLETEKNNTQPKKSNDRKNKTIVNKKDGKLKRQNKILSIIKDKGSVGIKDIATQIVDCSEKTIQRELIAMLNEGVITKEGERRWSTYSMA